MALFQQIHAFTITLGGHKFTKRLNIKKAFPCIEIDIFIECSVEFTPMKN